jgi:hypothetical protein
VEKKFPRTERLMVPRPSRSVLCNVRVNKPCAVGLEIHIRIADVGFAFPEGFNLRAVEDQSGLMFFKNMVVIGSGAVLRDQLLAGFCGLLCFFRRLGHNSPS